MDIPIPHESFTNRALSVQPAGFWKGAKLLLDGNEVDGKRGEFQVPDNSGMNRKVKLNASLFDPIPKVEIDGDKIELARPLIWYEYVWMGLPIALIFVGGGIGVLFGLAAVYSSARVFRSDRPTLTKYSISGLISLGAVTAWIVVAVAIRLMFGEAIEQ